MVLVRKKAYFIDASYTVRDSKTYVVLLLKGKKTVRLYYQHDPYFLVDASAEQMKNLLRLQAQRKDGSIAKPVRAEVIDKRIGASSKKFIKLYCEQPSDVPIIKSQVPFTCFEYNIPFARRFIFDMQLTPLHIIHYERDGRQIKKITHIENSAQPNLSILAFDIETYNPLGTPIEEKDPIIMISYCGKTKGVITYKKANRPFVETATGEKEMLECFDEIVASEDPDVLVGYNSSQFDLPYITIRVDKTKAALSLGRFGKALKTVNKGLIKGMRIEGRIHFDLFPIVKFFSFIGMIKTNSMSLDSVSEDVLGKKKLQVKKSEIWKHWDNNDIDQLCDYALVDSELTFALANRFLPIEMELSTVAKMPLFETALSTSGQLVENLLMYYASGKNILIPSKPGGEKISERLEAPIQGGFVKLPDPGIYEKIAVLDFRGLYPSIIISYNIDPGTLESAIAQPNNNQKEYYISPTSAVFSKKSFGLIPFVLGYLVDMRGKIKDKLRITNRNSEEYTRLSARSHGLKILANSFFGYTGYARSRWYSKPCAESITAWGRKHIQDTIQRAEEAKFTVLYSDTDSVFLLYKDKRDVLDFVSHINEMLPEKMELELEGFYTRGVFVSKRTADEEGTGAKKKYALLGEDGKIKIRGFELVRRDWSAIAKETQLKVLEAILKDGSKEKAAKIIRDTIDALRNGKIPIEKLAINTQITKALKDYDIISPELAAAKKLEKAGTRIQKGNIISFVIGKSGKSISEKAVPLEMTKDYDVDYYINNQILPAVMKIMKELGYDEYSMKVGGKQQSLDSFF